MSVSSQKHWGELADADLHYRLELLGEATAELSAAIDEGDALSELGPAVRVRSNAPTSLRSVSPHNSRSDKAEVPDFSRGSLTAGRR